MGARKTGCQPHQRRPEPRDFSQRRSHRLAAVAGPGVDKVVFEITTDSANYTLLGTGVRTSGGWQLTGLQLPQRQIFYIRTPGFYTCGCGDGIVEFIRAGLLRSPYEIFLPMIVR